MPRIFEENHITAKDLLPREQFCLGLNQNDKINPDALNRVRKNAEKLADMPIPMLLASEYMRYSVDGNRRDYEVLEYARRDIAYNLAVIESVDREGKYTGKIIDAVWAILEETSWVIPAHHKNQKFSANCPLPVTFGEYPDYVDLFNASTGATLAMVYYMMKENFDAVTPVINERLLYEIDRRLVMPFLTQDFPWTGETGGMVNNWIPWICSNMLTICAFAMTDENKRKMLMQRAMRYLDNYTAKYPLDGACDEGPGYWSGAVGAYFDCLEDIYDLTGGAVDLFDNDFIRRAGEYRCVMQINKNYVANFADAHPRATIPADFMYRFGKRVGSVPMMNCASEAAREHCFDTGRATFRPLMAYRCMMTTVPTDLPTASFRSTWFDSMKMMVVREYEETDRGFFLAIKGGHNDDSHNHNDVGSFIVYSGGEPVFVDAGVGTYTKKTFSDQRYTIWSMRSGYHNLPLINGCEQKYGRCYHSTNESVDLEKQTCEMEISGAWEKEAGLLSFVRRAGICDHAVIITDTIRTDRPSEIDFHFLAYPECEKIEEGKVRLNAGKILEYPKELTLEIENFTGDDDTIRSGWKLDHLVRLHLRASGVSEGSFRFVIR